MNIQAYTRLLEESDYKMKSIMQGVASGDAFLNLGKILDRLSFFDDFEELEIEMKENEDKAVVSLLYREERFNYHIKLEEVSVDHFFNLSHQLTEIEMERLRNAQMGITVVTHFNEDNLASYHLQIKILCTLLPNLSSIVDYSSLSILSGKWATLCAESEIPPPPSYLYRIHAVSGDNNEVWLHTHGLNRCGTIELEILNANKENDGYRAVSSVIETLAVKAIDNNLSEKELEPIFLGHDIVVTWKKWEETIEDFNCLGASYEDRVGHDFPCGVLFLYKSEEDYEQKRLSSMNDIIPHLQENPLFFISNKETQRMKSLAVERIDYVYENAFKNENKILIKVGVEVDEGYKDEENGFDTEHLWFELVDITKTTFTGVLLNQPYYIERLNEGDQFQFEDVDITDWIIYTSDDTIYPDTIYLLMIDNHKEVIDINENREAFIQQLQNWHEIDKHQEIIEACRSLDKLDYEVSSLYCRALNNFGLFDEAIKQMLTFKEEAKDDFKWHYRLSYSYDSVADYDNALKAIQASIDIEDGYAPAWLQLGFIYNGLDRHKEALEAFDKVFSLYEARGEDSGTSKDEVAYLKQVYEGIQEVIEDKRELDLYNLLTDLKEEGNFEEIKSILTNYSIEKYPFQLLKIEAHIVLKEYELALQSLEEVAEENKDHSKWLFHKFTVLKETGETLKADDIYKEYEKAKSTENEYVRIYHSENFTSVVLNIYKPKVKELSKLIEAKQSEFKTNSRHWERIVFNTIQDESAELLKYVKFDLDGEEFCVFYFEASEENNKKAEVVKEIVTKIIENKEATLEYVINNFDKINV